MDINVRPAVTQGSEDAMHVAITIWPTESAELTRIMTVHMPAWAELFAQKNAEYGDNAHVLGTKGQFADIWRKIGKLKTALWDDQPERLTSESAEEVILDLIGHLFLTLNLLRPQPTFAGHLPSRAGSFGQVLIQAIDEALSANEQSTADDPGQPVVEYPPQHMFVKETGYMLVKGAAVRWKQHLGQGELAYIDHFDLQRDSGNIVGVVRRPGEDIAAWAHPSWLIPEVDVDEDSKCTVCGGNADYGDHTHEDWQGNDGDNGDGLG